MDIGTIRGAVELKNRFTPELRQIQKDAAAFAQTLTASFKAMGGSVADVGKTLKGVGTVATTAGRAMTAGFTVPIAGALALAGNAAIGFESSFAGVRKTVNASEAEFAALEDAFRGLSKEIPISVEEINKIGEAAGQLGIKKANLVDFTEVMANLGVATNLSSDEAATALARLANITQMPQDNFERLGSTIVALGNNFATTEQEIVAMGLRIAGAGNQIGLTEGQILAVGTALSSVGIEAEAGGSAISRVMIDMASAVSGGGEALSQFASAAGMSSQQFATAFKADAAGALDAFVTGLGQMNASGGDVLKTLEDMGIEEIRMRDALLRAAGAGDLLTRALALQDEAWRQNTALADEASKRYATVESQWQLIKNELNDVAIELGNALLPMIRALVEQAKPFLGLLGDMAKGFGALPAPIQTAGVVLGGLLAAAGPVLMMLGSLASAAATLAPFFAAGTTGAAILGGALTVLTGPIGLVAGAVAGLGLAWMTWGDDVTRVVSETYQSVKGWLWDKLEPVLTPIGGLLKSLGEMFSAFGDLVGAVAKLAVGYVADFVRDVGVWLLDRFRPVIEPARALIETVGTVFRATKDTVIGLVKALYEGVKLWLLDRFTSIVDGIKGKIDAVTGFFREMYDEVVGNSFVPDMIDQIRVEFGKLVEHMVNPTQRHTTAVGGFFEGMGQNVMGICGGWLSELNTLIGQGMDAIFGEKGPLGKVGNLAGSVLSAGLNEALGAAAKAIFGGGGTAAAAGAPGAAGSAGVAGMSFSSIGTTFGANAVTALQSGGMIALSYGLREGGSALLDAIGRWIGGPPSLGSPENPLEETGPPPTYDDYDDWARRQLGVPVMDVPIHAVTSPGLVRVNPGDIVGMPHLTFGAKPFRASGGGGNGTRGGMVFSPTFVIQAWDGPSVSQWLRNGGARQIAQEVVRELPGEVDVYGVAN